MKAYVVQELDYAYEGVTAIAVHFNEPAALAQAADTKTDRHGRFHRYVCPVELPSCTICKRPTSFCAC